MPRESSFPPFFVLLGVASLNSSLRLSFSTATAGFYFYLHALFLSLTPSFSLFSQGPILHFLQEPISIFHRASLGHLNKTEEVRYLRPELIGQRRQRYILIKLADLMLIPLNHI